MALRDATVIQFAKRLNEASKRLVNVKAQYGGFRSPDSLVQPSPPESGDITLIAY